MKTSTTGLASLVSLLVVAMTCSTGGKHGRFSGNVKTEWVDPDRKMELLEDFSYIDPEKVEWKAPKGSVIDGASIPRWLWTVVGSPFTGSYRNASVVHDVACAKKIKPWASVHRMFYEACLCGGVDESKAKVLYAAVYHFGPRWGGVPGAELGEVRTVKTPQEFETLRAYIQQANPSLSEIESFAPDGRTPPIATVPPR